MKSFVQLRSGLMALSVSVQTKQKGAFKMAFSHIDVQLIFFECSLLCTVGLVSFEYVCAVTRSIPFDQLIYFTWIESWPCALWEVCHAGKKSPQITKLKLKKIIILDN